MLAEIKKILFEVHLDEEGKKIQKMMERQTKKQGRNIEHPSKERQNEQLKTIINHMITNEKHVIPKDVPEDETISQEGNSYVLCHQLDKNSFLDSGRRYLKDLLKIPTNERYPFPA